MKLSIAVALLSVALIAKEPTWQEGIVSAIDKGTIHPNEYGLGTNKAMFYAVQIGEREITGVSPSPTRFSDYKLLPLTVGDSVLIAVQNGKSVVIKTKDGKIYKLTFERERTLHPN